MQSDTGQARGSIDSASGDAGPRLEIERLRRTRRRQAAVIATLSQAISNFHRGISALRAENAQLRDESNDLKERLSGDKSRADDELFELVIEAGPGAPSAARRAITAALAHRVADPVIANAQLLMSELVTNSVRHSRMPDGDELIVRLRMWQDGCRLEVEDPGHDGVIAPQSPDLVEGGGIGLNLVQSLSERWGLMRAADGPTRVWAQLKCGAALDRASRLKLAML